MGVWIRRVDTCFQTVGVDTETGAAGPERSITAGSGRQEAAVSSRSSGPRCDRLVLRTADHLVCASLDTDYFWAIPREQRNDPCSKPSELTIGQLTESLDNVERMVSDHDSTLAYGLVWLSDVLRAVGEEVVR